MTCHLVLFFFFLSLGTCSSSFQFNHSARALEDFVESLPGLDEPLPALFSGFLEITSSNRLYYALAEAEEMPSWKPLLVWTNSGPGCSGLVSFLTEFGPVKLKHPENHHPSHEEWQHMLEKNPYSWSRLANVLYLEQPVGVGYSHVTEGTAEPQYSDHLSAIDNLLALEAFFERFPDLREQDIYLASEGYGGHFTVQLLQEIYSFYSEHPTEQRAHLYHQIKGIVVGNPFVNFNTGYVARAEALWGLQLIPAFEWKSFRDSGCSDIQTHGEFLASKESCPARFDSLLSSVGPHIDLYNINYDVCAEGTSTSGIMPKSGLLSRKSITSRQLASTLEIMSRRMHIPFDRSNVESGLDDNVGDDAVGDHVYANDPHDDFDDASYFDDDASGILDEDKEASFETCLYHYMGFYLNEADVKEALHIPSEVRWVSCNEEIQSAWPLSDFLGSTLPDFEAVIKRNLQNSSSDQKIKILIYSGDNDIITPTVGTQRWVFELPHEPTSLWRPWYFTNKTEAGGVGGYVTQFNSSFTLVTLHEGGHMVAAYQPRQAYDMIKSFLYSEEFFTPPDEVKVLKLYYSLTLQEYRTEDATPSAPGIEGEAAEELGSDKGYEFVRDAIRHCMFHHENITISGKLVDVFAIKVHHAYEVDLDAYLVKNNEHNVGQIPVDDDFLFENLENRRRVSSPDENVKVNYDWDGLVYDKREVIVVAVEVVISTFEHLYDLKTELDVAFDTTLKTGQLQRSLRKSLHAHHRAHDNQGGDVEHPYSDIMSVVIEKSSCDSMEWFSADIVPSSKKQRFDYTNFFRLWEDEYLFLDDDMARVSHESEMEILEYSAINLGVAIVTFSLTVMVVAGTFLSYRQYHDRLMYRLGYEIQDDFDALLDSNSDGMEMTAGRRKGGFVIESEDDDEDASLSHMRL